MVHIFFGKMSYQILEEEPAYTFITMMGMSDIAFFVKFRFLFPKPQQAIPKTESQTGHQIGVQK